jgi:hypothetical protein
MINAKDDVQARAKAIEVLARHPQRVELSILPDSGARVVIKPDPRAAWKVAAIYVVGIALAAGCGVLMSWLRRGGRIDLPFFAMPWAFYTFALIGLGVLAMLALGRLVGGPAREVVFEVYPGRLKIDRYIAGDHVVREYRAAAEILAIYVDAALTFQTRTNTFSTVSAFCPIEVHEATAELLGAMLWGNSAIICRDALWPGAYQGRARVLVCDGGGQEIERR